MPLNILGKFEYTNQHSMIHYRKDACTLTGPFLGTNLGWKDKLPNSLIFLRNESAPI